MVDAAALDADGGCDRPRGRRFVAASLKEICGGVEDLASGTQFRRRGGACRSGGSRRASGVALHGLSRLAGFDLTPYGRGRSGLAQQQASRATLQDFVTLAYEFDRQFDQAERWIFDRAFAG